MSAPHDRPSVAEIIDAVRGWMEHGDPTRFQARIATHALAIAEREVALGDAHEEAHRRRLDALGFTDDEELAAAIHNGSLDDRYDEVAAALRAMVADKLAVANPSYGEPG